MAPMTRGVRCQWRRHSDQLCLQLSFQDRWQSTYCCRRVTIHVNIFIFIDCNYSSCRYVCMLNALGSLCELVSASARWFTSTRAWVCARQSMALWVKDMLICECCSICFFVIRLSKTRACCVIRWLLCWSRCTPSRNQYFHAICSSFCMLLLFL